MRAVSLSAGSSSVDFGAASPLKDHKGLFVDVPFCVQHSTGGHLDDIESEQTRFTIKLNKSALPTHPLPRRQGQLPTITYPTAPNNRDVLLIDQFL